MQAHGLRLCTFRVDVVATFTSVYEHHGRARTGLIWNSVWYKHVQFSHRFINWAQAILCTYFLHIDNLEANNILIVGFVQYLFEAEQQYNEMVEVGPQTRFSARGSSHLSLLFDSIERGPFSWCPCSPTESCWKGLYACWVSNGFLLIHGKMGVFFFLIDISVRHLTLFDSEAESSESEGETTPSFSLLWIQEARLLEDDLDGLLLSRCFGCFGSGCFDTHRLSGSTLLWKHDCHEFAPMLVKVVVDMVSTAWSQITTRFTIS